MSSILGLISGKTFADQGFRANHDRRQVFHQYPNGAATLTGLLSTMESEVTDHPVFGWNEKRWKQPQTQLTAPGGVFPFSPSGSDVASASPLTFVAGTIYRLKVADSSEFRVTHTILLQRVPLSDTTFIEVRGVITSVPSATRIEFRVAETAAAVLNSANTTTSGTKGPVNAYVITIGTANEEGSNTQGNGRLILPCNPQNYTQIFRTPFGFTNTALKEPATFDKTGIYREKSKDNCVDHMTEIEKAFLFGTKAELTVANEENEDMPLRFTGGVEYFLRQYEAADSMYRGGTGAAALTLDTDYDKRIITNATGTMTRAVWNEYVERMFRVTNNKTYEKLVLCGGSVLTTINTMVESRIVINKNMPAESTFGMNVTSIETPHGILHFKSHPLFTENPVLRYTMMVLDVQNMRYRNLTDRDTHLKKLIQLPGADRRKDEWLTEAGLECRKPEANFMIYNFQAVTLT
jgi:hypothetical protein